MAGPTIARAEIQVDLNGQRIPAEAAALGHETGALAGDRFGDGWEKRVNAGVDRSMRSIVKTLQRNGQIDSLGDTLRRKLTAPLLELESAGRRTTAAIGSGFRSVQSSAETAFGNVRRLGRDAFSELKALPAGTGEAFVRASADARRSIESIGTSARSTATAARGEVARLAIEGGQAWRTVATDARISLGAARVEASRFGLDAEQVFKGLGPGIRASLGNLKLDTVGAANGRSFGQHLGDATMGELTTLNVRAERAFRTVGASATNAFTGASTGVRREFEKVDSAVRTTADGLRSRLAGAFTDVRTRVSDAFTAMGSRVRSLRDAAEPVLQRLSDKVRLAATNIRNDLPNAFRDAGQFIAGATGHFNIFNANLDSARARGHQFRLEVGNDFAKIGDVFAHAFRNAKDGFTGFKRDASESAAAGSRLGRTVEKLGSTIGGFGRGIGTKLRDVGDGFKKIDTDASNASKGGIHLARAGLVALVALAIALGPEITTLGFAAGALGQAAGSAFVAAAVGGLALKTAITSVLTSVKDLPAAVQPAARAMQDFIGTIDDKGKFTLSKQLTDVKNVLLTHTWQNMAGPVRELAAAVDGPLKVGMGHLGDSLQIVIRGIAKFFTLPAGANALHDFFSTVSDLLPGIANALGAAAGAGVVLFRESMSFTRDALSSLTDMLNGFIKFSRTVKGDASIDDWFFHAKLVLGHVGTALHDIGLAFVRMVTPEAEANLNALLDSIGTTALSLGRFMTTLEPLGGLIGRVLTGVGTILDTINPGLDAVTHGLATVGKAAIDLVLTIVRAAGPAVNAVLSIVGKVLGGIGAAFAGAMPDIKHLLGDIGTLLSGLLPGFKQLDGERLTGATGALKGIVRVLDDIVTGATNAAKVIDSLSKSLGVVDGSKIGELSTQLQKLTGKKYLIDLSPPKSSDADWLQFLGDLEAHLTDFVVTSEVAISQLINMFADLGKAVADLGQLTAALGRGDMPAAARAAAQLGKDMNSAFKNFNGTAALTTGQLRDMKNQIEDHINSFGLVGKAADHYISLLTGLPKSVKTAILLDDISAGQRLSNFQATFKQLTKPQQLKLLLDASKAGQDLSAFRATIAKLPLSKRFTIINNVAQAGGQISGLKSVIETLPTRQQFTILNNAAKAGSDISRFKSIIVTIPARQQFTIIENAVAHAKNVGRYADLIRLLPKSKQFTVIDNAALAGKNVGTLSALVKGLPPSKQLKIITDALAAGVPVKALRALIQNLHNKDVKITTDTVTGTAKAKALQALITGIRQGKPVGLLVDNLRGIAGVRGLQAGINAIRQGKVPGLTANNAPGRAVIHALQAAIDAIRQGGRPPLGVNSGPALGTLSALQARIDALHGKTVTVTTVLQTVNAARAASGAQPIAANGGLFNFGAGGGVKAFADGGVNARDGMIAPGGSNILWAEPSTGWEAYISGKAGQSQRNIATWMEAGRRLGVLGAAGSKTVNVTQNFASPNADPQQVAAAAVDRLVPQL